MNATVSTTAAECEIGIRGNVHVDSKNRGLVRKWLVAKGLPALFVGGLSILELRLAYNDVSDSEFRKLQDKLRKAQVDVGDGESLDAAETEFLQHAHANATTTTAAVNVSVQNDGTAGATLASLVAPYLSQSVLSDVMSKVDAKLADVQITRIEVTRADSTVHVVDGHQHPNFSILLKAMAARNADGFHPNIMLCGPTGSGKTHAVKMAAKALGLEFYTNGALTMDHQVVGFIDANGNYHETAFRKGFGRPAAYLFDEMDSSDNSPLLALAGGLANGQNAFPDQLVERHPDSVIIAAGNTWGHGATAEFVGRNRIDGAIRSRFPVRIHWDYDEALEIAISGNPTWVKRVQRARSKARAAGLKVTIDPRMSQAGAALIAQGFTSEEAAQMTYLADLSAEQRRIVDAD